MSFLKQLFCKHKYGTGSWSYVKCTKCEKVKYNPELANKLLKERADKMPWSNEDKEKFKFEADYKKGI